MTNESQNKPRDASGLLVQIASYNTNLQGVLGLPQDLVDWLAPTLQVSNFLSGGARAPDIVAVGFQELLPLHLGLAGLSKPILDNRHALILSQIEHHAPSKEKYSLVAKIANVGVAILVYARDDGVARRISDVQATWTGSGPAFMGNKGAVGIRFRVADEDGSGNGETFTFVDCHLTAHDHNVRARLDDWKHIVSSLLFAPSTQGGQPSTLYDSTHLFAFGDMNFRLELPSSHPLCDTLSTSRFAESISSESTRKELQEYDQLTVEKGKGNIFVGLHEGDFWRFKPSYKYKVGTVDQYSTKRTPSWTDRILYATHTDTPEQSTIKNLLYTSVPSYTTSDHKPVVSLLLLPPSPTTPSNSSSSSVIPLPSSYRPIPDPNANLKRYIGRTLDRFIGVIWWIFTLLGAGSGLFGFINLIVGLGAFTWWKGSPNGSPTIGV